MSVGVKPAASIVSPPGQTAPDSSVTVRAVLRRGLRDYRRAMLIWGAALGSYGALMAAIYPSIRHSIEQIIKTYPSGLKQAFGAETMNTVEGYLHAEMFSLIVPLAIGYFVIRLIAAATVGAEERGYLDTTLALPISRQALMFGTYLVAGIASAAIMVLAGALTYIVGMLAGTQISLGLVAAGVTGVWVLALFFGGVAALASGALHSSRTVYGVAVGTLVAMYALDVAGRLAHGLDPIRWASAFRYYGAPMRDGIDPLSLTGLATVGALSLIAGSLLLDRRDVLH